MTRLLSSNWLPLLNFQSSDIFTDYLTVVGEPGFGAYFQYTIPDGILPILDLTYDIVEISGNEYIQQYDIDVNNTTDIVAFGFDLSFSLTNNSDKVLQYEISGSFFDFSGDTLVGSLGTTPPLNKLVFSKTLNAYGQLRLIYRAPINSDDLFHTRTIVLPYRTSNFI